MKEKGSDEMLFETATIEDVMKLTWEAERRLTHEQDRIEQTEPATDEPGRQHKERKPPAPKDDNSKAEFVRRLVRLVKMEPTCQLL